MTDTYKVTLPLAVTLEIDANTGPATVEMIRQAFAHAFRESAPFDPLAETKIRLVEASPFTIGDTATIKTAILTDESAIEIDRA